MKFFWILLLLVFSSCKAQQTWKSTEENPKSVRSELHMLFSDYYGGSETSKEQIFRDNGELAKFFARINKTRKPRLPLPKIDFTEEVVILINTGTQVGGKLPELQVGKQNSEYITLLVTYKEENLTTDNEVVNAPFCLYRLSNPPQEIRIKH